MEWVGLVKGILGLAGLMSICIAYYWGFKRGKAKGFTEGWQASEENWKKDKIRIYNAIQKGKVVKAEKSNAKIID